MVEVEDEFGRAIQVPQRLAYKYAKEEERPLLPEDDQPDEPVSFLHFLKSHTNYYNRHNVYYGDQTHFPVFEISQEELQKRQRALAEADLPIHYDANSENRTRGAGHYTFSKDVEERAEQMESIKAGRAAVDRDKQAEDAVVSREKQAELDRRAELDARKKRLLERREAANSDRPAQRLKLDDS